MKLPPALRFLEANAWALRPEVFEALADIVARHSDGVRLDDAQIRSAIGGADDSANAEPSVQMVGSTAVVSVRGVIARYADQVNGACQPAGRSAEALLGDLEALAGNPRVRAVALRIDSPGGTVAGTAEVADAVRGISAAGTPVYAFVDGLAASAAYWIASQADEIVVAGPTSAVGSIGVIAAHVERQPGAGTKVHVFRSARLKAPGTMGEALDSDQRASIQRHIDDLAEAFGTAVAAGRGFTDAQQAAAATGEVFAAKRAQALGLIDAVEPWGAFLARIASGGGARATGGDATEPSPAYTTGAQVDETASAPEPDAMKLTAAVILALCASHPDHLALINERATAGDDEAQVRGAIAKADAAKAKERAETEAKAKDARIVELEAKVAVGEKSLADANAKLADVTAKHDALAALKSGAKGNNVKPDADAKPIAKVTRAQYDADPAAVGGQIRAGLAQLVDG